MKAIIDPDEVRAFANLLGNVAETMRRETRSIQGEFHDLRDVWRDQKYAAFEPLFAETVAQLDRFVNDAEDYSRYLVHKAGIIEEYLGQ